MGGNARNGMNRVQASVNTPTVWGFALPSSDWVKVSNAARAAWSSTSV